MPRSTWTSSRFIDIRILNSPVEGSCKKLIMLKRGLTYFQLCPGDSLSPERRDTSLLLVLESIAKRYFLKSSGSIQINIENWSGSRLPEEKNKIEQWASFISSLLRLNGHATLSFLSFTLGVNGILEPLTPQPSQCLRE